MADNDNIVKLPDPLERRAVKIEAALTRRDKGKAEWVEGTIELAVELAGVRGEFPADQAFGEWLESRFPNARIPKNERYILIKWGNDVERTRAILETTESGSIQLIHQNEWRIKPPVQPPLPFPPQQPKIAPVPPPQNTSPQPPPEPAPVVQRTVHKPSPAAVLKQFSREEAIRQGMEVPPLALNTETVNSIHKQVRDLAGAVPNLAGKARRSFEKTLAAEMTKLLAEFNLLKEKTDVESAVKIEQEVKRRLDVKYPEYEKRVTAAREREEYYGKLIKAVKIPLTDAEYNNIVMCCHPDNSASKERRDTALQVLNAKKLNLTGKK
jgi:hypothetical protein